MVSVFSECKAYLDPYFSQPTKQSIRVLINLLKLKHWFWSTDSCFFSLCPLLLNFIVVFPLLNHGQFFATTWTATHQASLSFTISWSLLKLISTELMLLFNCLIPYCPLILPPSIFPSIKIFSNESALCIRWPKYWSFSFSISSSREYSGLISYRIGWFDLLALQRTLKCLLQHHNSNV